LLSGAGGKEIQSSIIRYAQSHQWEIVSIAPREKRLDALFRELTNS